MDTKYSTIKAFDCSIHFDSNFVVSFQMYTYHVDCFIFLHGSILLLILNKSDLGLLLFSHSLVYSSIALTSDICAIDTFTEFTDYMGSLWDISWRKFCTGTQGVNRSELSWAQRSSIHYYWQWKILFIAAHIIPELKKEGKNTTAWGSAQAPSINVVGHGISPAPAQYIHV